MTDVPDDRLRGRRDGGLRRGGGLRARRDAVERGRPVELDLRLLWVCLRRPVLAAN